MPASFPNPGNSRMTRRDRIEGEKNTRRKERRRRGRKKEEKKKKEETSRGEK